MGMYYEAYVAYGALIQRPDYVDYDMIENMDTAGTRENEIMTKYKLKHLIAGNYDRDMFFLVTASESVKLGSYVMINDISMKNFNYVDNSSRILDGAEELGLEILDGPGWVLVPDLS